VDYTLEVVKDPERVVKDAKDLSEKTVTAVKDGSALEMAKDLSVKGFEMAKDGTMATVEFAKEQDVLGKVQGAAMASVSWPRRARPRASSSPRRRTSSARPRPPPWPPSTSSRRARPRRPSSA